MKHILFTIFIFVSGIEMYSQSRFQLTGEIYTTENIPVADAVMILKDSLVNTTAYNTCQLSLYVFCNIYMYDGKMTTHWQNKYETDNIQSISLIKGEPIGVGLRFNYYFGNKKVNGTNERKTSGSESKRRL